MRLPTRSDNVIVDALRPGTAPVVRAIVETILAREVGPGVDSADLDHTARVMGDRIARMPRYLGAGLSALTLLFETWGVPRGGRPFTRLDPARRAAQVRAWKTARIGFQRDFVDFYEKMGIFVYWSHIEETRG